MKLVKSRHYTKLKRGSRYHIKWSDIQSEAKWQTAEDILNTEPAITEGTYFYIGKGKAGYCFAGEANDGDFGNSTIIPSLQDIKSIKAIH